MFQYNKEGIKEICQEVDQIMAGTLSTINYPKLSGYLKIALMAGVSYEDVDLVCNTIVKIATFKHKSMRNIEKYFWDFMDNLPMQIMFSQALEIGDNEELLPNFAYDNEDKRILSRVLGLVYEILALKFHRDKGGDFIRAHSLHVLEQLNDGFHIPGAKEIFLGSIKTENQKEQYAALKGLARYYEITEEEMEEKWIEKIYDLINATDDRSIASTCLQILINAGVIDEFTAVCQMDDWKDAHYR